MAAVVALVPIARDMCSVVRAKKGGSEREDPEGGQEEVSRGQGRSGVEAARMLDEMFVVIEGEARVPSVHAPRLPLPGGGLP